MDVLSEVLKIVKLEGALFFNAELSAPWCLLEPRSDRISPYLSPSANHLILYHYVMEGRAYARAPLGERVELSAGDVIVFPHGDEHYLGNGTPERPVDSLKVFEKNLADGLKLARFGGGGEATRIVCGYMVCDRRIGDVFLSVLPRLLKVHIKGEAWGEWLDNSIRYSVDEDGSSIAGRNLIVAKLSEVLFVETLRRYINELPADQIGWLAGVRDQAVGRALALIHAEPSREWTISNLARAAGLSRSTLAERFKHFLDTSPMAYLAEWRLKLASELLASSDDSVTTIASTVGYGSESALSRAFKRKFGAPPAQYRRDQKRR